MKTIQILAALVLLFCQNTTMATGSIEDTRENRQLQADRYLEVNSPEDIFLDIVERTRQMLPEKERQTFVDIMTRYLDQQVLGETMHASLVEHFTAEEIAVMADFYSKPAAKSAMSKIGLYMSDIMPVVQAEMFKAQQRATQSGRTE